MTPPLIVGAGPAGCAAAITLAQAGARPLLIDRDAAPRDPLCGGFLSWRTLAQLRDLGVQPDALCGHEVQTLRIFARGKQAELPLPRPALGLSRHALDTALRAVALAAGTSFERHTISEISAGEVIGRTQKWPAQNLFLATGKHDVRGLTRPRHSGDPALGLRLRLPASAERTALLGGAIELHLFRGGYAGIVLQEGGSANLCLALRKSTLAKMGNSRAALLHELAAESPAFAARIGEDWRYLHIDSIGSVPYGWIARKTVPGLFRLGDQAAVIPSLAGEGIGIALASGQMAARHWLAGGGSAAPVFQREFARTARPPMRLASLARHLAEDVNGGGLIRALAAHAPWLVHRVAEWTRIDPTRAPTHALAQTGEPA